MQPGALVTSDVMAYTSRVLVNGAQRPVLSWSIDRELSGDLPVGVSSSAGVTQATGNIEWASDDDVTDGGLNPWNPSTGWIPVEGDKVEIWAGDGTTEWKQFTGVIDSSDGSNNGGLQSKIIDRTDDLSAIFSAPAMVAAMPPLGDVLPEDDWGWRYVGPSTQFYMNAAARAAGFHSTPPPGRFCIIDAPMQGSMWPLVGHVVDCSRSSDPGVSPDYFPAPWGEVRSDMNVLYQPSTFTSMVNPVQITLLRNPETHAGTARVNANFEDNSAVSLRLGASTAEALVNGTPVVLLSDVSDCTVIQVLFKDGVARLRTDKGHDVTGAYTWTSTAVIKDVRITADANARIAGLQVHRPQLASSEFQALSWSPTFSQHPGWFRVFNTDATPAIDNRSARDVIDEISAATLHAVWIDELGVLHAESADYLWNRYAVRTLTTLDDVRELAWSRDLLSVRSQVVGKYKTPIVSKRAGYAVPVWQAGLTAQINDDETNETLIEPGPDEDWIMVDPNPVSMGRPDWPYSKINRGYRSLIGGTYTDGVNEYYAESTVRDKITTSFETLGPRAYKLTTKGINIENGYQVELRTLSTNYTGNPALWPRWWGKDLPIIRAKARIEWADTNTEPMQGAPVGPVYEHDFGPWATAGPDDADRMVVQILEFIRDQTLAPHPVITQLRVGYDPRLQLGDMVIIESPGLMGVNLRCLITGVSISAGDTYDMNLSVRVISVETTHTTYAEFAKAWGNTADYTTLATAWGAASTYTDFNTNPLQGAQN